MSNIALLSWVFCNIYGPHFLLPVNKPVNTLSLQYFPLYTSIKQRMGNVLQPDTLTCY